MSTGVTEPTLSTPLKSAFAGVLESRRARYNALFADARRVRPSLDPEAFAAHLRGVVAPIVDRAAAYAPAAAGPVTDALYELSLDLIGQEFLGPRSRYPALVEGWQHLLIALAPLVAHAPRVLPGAVTNALYQLATTPGARPREWMQSLATVAPHCADLDTLLQAGQVAAWRAGLAHYRRSALDRAASLPPAAALAALGLPLASRPAPDPDLIQAAIARLKTDPWLDPESALSDAIPDRRLHLVRRAGAFRGFGGQFLAPPTVTHAEGQFTVSDGDNHWRLFADRFGATLHRTAAPPSGEKPKRRRLPFTVAPDGTVTHGSLTATFPDLADRLSFAADDTTLAVTTPLSHSVFLVAVVSSHHAS